MILADLHTHSNNSPDGEAPIKALCDSATEKKLSYLAVTDHCEIDLYQKDRYEMRLRQSYLDMLWAQDEYDGRLTIIKGVELGNALNDKLLAEKVVESRPYDVVLGSLHHLLGIDDFAFLDFKVMEVPALVRRYYQELEELVDWGNFDVLTHLTYPLRYINGIYHYNINIQDYADQLERIFAKIITKKIALEINSSGLRQPYGLTLPDLWCVKMYRGQGGERITVGSDAHTAEHVGANITDALAVAKEAGFDSYCVYSQRAPKFIKIA